MRDILIIDNFDSFTYNLVEEFATLGCQVEVQRNDRALSFITQRLNQLNDPLVVFSPGPGTPEGAGICIEAIRAFAGKVPMLGICLGHQAMTVAFGGTVGRAPIAMHGERSYIEMQPHYIFEGLASRISVGRYHSLIATQLPSCLSAIAKTDDLVMAICHESHAMVGLQFHPESILSTYGSRMLRNAVTHLRENL